MPKGKRLTEQNRDAIRRFKADHPRMTLKQLAHHFGVSIACVSQTFSGEYKNRRSIPMLEPPAPAKPALMASPHISWTPDLKKLMAGR